jgi:uncharacterized protein (DUF952 family)
VILHFCGRDDWASAQIAGVYAADTLQTEGFIHCSTIDTVLIPANAIARGRHDLVLLEIDDTRLDAPVRIEGGFPHVYGPIPVEAVIAVHDFPCRSDGMFELPASL